MPECKESCPQLDKLEHEVRTLRDQNSETHREIFKRLNELELTNAVQNERYDAILEKLDTLTQKVEALEAKPGKRWEGIVDKAIWAVLAAIIAFLLGKAGL